MNSMRMRSLFVVSCLAAFITVGCGQGSPLTASGSPGSIMGPTLLMADGEIDPAAAASATGEFTTLAKGGNRGDALAGGEKAKKDKGEGGVDDEGDAGDDDLDHQGKKGKGPKGDDAAEADDDDDEDSDGPGGNGRGSLSGFVTAVTTNSLTVRDVIVTVTDATVIRHGGNRSLTMSDIQVGDHVQVKGTSTASGTGTTFTAAEIKVEDMKNKGGDDDEGSSEIEGKIASQTGTCPSLTFNIGTTKVTTNASTTFDDGSCTDLANDKTVEVTGTVQSDGSILATKVDLEDASETEGAISALSGTCPTLTFTVATKIVKTNSSTVFEGVACSALLNSTVVEIKGTAQADGSILATNVERD